MSTLDIIFINFADRLQILCLKILQIGLGYCIKNPHFDLIKKIQAFISKIVYAISKFTPTKFYLQSPLLGLKKFFGKPTLKVFRF